MCFDEDKPYVQLIRLAARIPWSKEDQVRHSSRGCTDIFLHTTDSVMSGFRGDNVYISR
jgi:hypothetical protein